MAHKNPVLTEDFLRELEEVLYVNTNIPMKLKYKSTKQTGNHNLMMKVKKKQYKKIHQYLQKILVQKNVGKL